MGNIAPKRYEVLQPIASGGPGFAWTVYDAKVRATEESVSIFVCDLKELAKQISGSNSSCKGDIEAMLAYLRQDIKTLARIRHPCVLKVVEVIPETSKYLSVVTEPISGSLANACKDFTGLPCEHVTEAMRTSGLSEFEIAYGVMNVARALQFLHSHKMVHGNLSLENVYLAADGKWKLGGLGMLARLSSFDDQATMPPFQHWKAWDQWPTPPRPAPTLGFVDPETCVEPFHYGTSSDVWALGALVFRLFTNGPLVPTIGTRGSLQEYYNAARNATATPGPLLDDRIKCIPATLRLPLVSCWHPILQSRPTVTSFLDCEFFSVGPIKTLRSIDDLLEISDPREQAVGLSKLPTELDQFPSRILKQIILPTLLHLARNPVLCAYALPSVLRAAKKLDSADLNALVVPSLVTIMKPAQDAPPQVPLQLAQHGTVLLELGDEAFARDHVIPMICRSLESFNTPDVMVAALKNMPAVCDACIIKISATHRQALFMSTILPRLAQCVVKAPSLRIQVQALIAIAHIVETKHVNAIATEKIVVPALQQCLAKACGLGVDDYVNVGGGGRGEGVVRPKSDPAVLMCCLGGMHTCAKVVAPSVVARKLLPSLIPLLCEQSLNSSQVSIVANHIKSMVDSLTAHRSASTPTSAQNSTKPQHDSNINVPLPSIAASAEILRPQSNGSLSTNANAANSLNATGFPGTSPSSATGFPGTRPHSNAQSTKAHQSNGGTITSKAYMSPSTSTSTSTFEGRANPTRVGSGSGSSDAFDMLGGLSVGNGSNQQQQQTTLQPHGHYHGNQTSGLNTNGQQHQDIGGMVMPMTAPSQQQQQHPNMQSRPASMQSQQHSTNMSNIPHQSYVNRPSQVQPTNDPFSNLQPTSAQQQTNSSNGSTRNSGFSFIG